MPATTPDGADEPRRMQQPEDVQPEQLAADAWGLLEHAQDALNRLELPDQIHPSEAVQRIAAQAQLAMAQMMAALTATVQNAQADTLERIAQYTARLAAIADQQLIMFGQLESPSANAEEALKGAASAFARGVAEASGPLEVVGDAQEHYAAALRELGDEPPRDGDVWPTGGWARAQWHLMRGQALEGFDRRPTGEPPSNGSCPSHGEHPHDGMVCLDCSQCRR